MLTTISSAVFLPRPLIFDRDFTSPVAIATVSELRSAPLKICIAIFGPTPLMSMSLKNSVFSSIDEKPYNA